MRLSRRFRPSAIGPLEDRIALSHAGVAAEVVTARAALVVPFRGTFTTTVPTLPGAAETSRLAGSSRIAHVGTVKLTGNLTANASVTPNPSAFLGTFTLGVKGNSAILAVFGPSGTNLAPRTPTTDNFTVTVVSLSGSATGPFASLLGTSGTAALTLKAGVPHHGRSTGSFSLVIAEG